MAVLTNTSKLKKILLFYWLLNPVLFGMYLFLMSLNQGEPIGELLTYIPSLALTSIIAWLSIFQAFGLYFVGSTSDCRHSLFGYFLIFSMIQQLLTLNIIGLALTGLLYRSLFVVKEENELSNKLKIVTYSLMIFVGLLTIIVVLIRFSI